MELFTPENLIALLTLTSLEVVLGIDNIVFLSILTGKLPPEKRRRAQRIGLGLAMIMRILLLLCIKQVMNMNQPLFSVFSHGFSGRDLILLVGGLFLLAKATHEIHEKLEGAHQAEANATAKAVASFGAILVQIVAIDMVFSLDSVITAVGMAQHLEVMALAIVIAVFFMMGFAGTVSRFVDEHPTLKVLALSFLLIVGMALVADGLDFHIPKGYIYFAMAFSVFVEILNIQMRKRAAAPVHLHTPEMPKPAEKD